jgi:hypothetical protein
LSIEQCFLSIVTHAKCNGSGDKTAANPLERNCFSVKRTKKEIVKTKFGLKMPRPVPSKPKNNDALILEACFIAGSDHK